MRQSYKVRLGDGTVLLVDHAGLTNWLDDRRALVQPAGDELWTPLRSFLVQEGSGGRRTGGGRPPSHSTSRRALPLVYPKPPGEPAASSRGDAPTGQRPGTSGEAKHPTPARADGLPLIPPPPKPTDHPPKPPDGMEVTGSPASVSPPPLVPPPLPEAAALPVTPQLKAPPPLQVPSPLPPAPAPLSQAPPSLSASPAPPESPLALPANPSEEEFDLSLSPAEAAPEPTPTEPPLPLPPKPPEEESDLGLSVAQPALAALTIEAEDPAPFVGSPTQVETVPEPEDSPAHGEEQASDADSGASSLPADEDEDVGWMTLPEPPGNEPPEKAAMSWLDPIAPSPVGGGVRQSRRTEAPRPTPSSARPALEAQRPSHRQWFRELARRAFSAARLWLVSLASTPYRALIGIWKSLDPGGHAAPTSLFGELARSPVVGSEASVRPARSVGAPPAERRPAQKRRASPAVYRPRKSPHDGLPLLQLEPVDEAEDRPGFSSRSDAHRSTDDLPEVILDPIDELPRPERDRARFAGNIPGDE